MGPPERLASFRDRLLATLRLAQPVLDVVGVLVAGSDVPNLVEPGAGATLVVSKDVDIAVPVAAHEEVKRRLAALRGTHPAKDELSVWVANDPALLEFRLIGYDPSCQDRRTHGCWRTPACR
ncbi:MAG: hypothetical protein AMXMBFR64_47070 [Myxococcales bacterium]